MAKKIRKSVNEEERMTDANIKKVIEMLASDTKPWTKKEACAYLGMAYNTSRLANVISSYEEKEANDKARRAEKKGTPVNPQEILYIIESYIKGDSIEAIAKAMYRGSSTVRRVLVENAVTLRPIGHSYFTPALIPDAATKDKFAIGETVYSAQYNSYAEIKSEQKHEEYGNVYRVWLLGEHQQSAYVPAHELASLEHITKMGIKI